MRVLQVFATEFDDPNLVSCAGLVPVLALAERAGLQRLVAEHVQIDTRGGGNAQLKVPSLSPGWSPARTPLMTWTCCGTAG